jgi:hypothetical protein
VFAVVPASIVCLLLIAGTLNVAESGQYKTSKAARVSVKASRRDALLGKLGPSVDDLIVADYSR